MRTLILVIAVGLAAYRCGAQTTNAIPPNVYVTDDGKLFWYKPGQRLVSVDRIEEARRSPESRPAEQDPAGHWGSATNGLQLALRFEKERFTSGEPIVAVSLIRNVTDKSVTYFRPIRIIATKDGRQLKRRDGSNTGPLEIHMAPETTLFPQTQNRNQENLREVYDLSQGGEYFLQAFCHRPEVASQKVRIVVASSTSMPH